MYLDGLIHSETFRNHLPRDTKMLKHPGGWETEPTFCILDEI